MADRPASRRSNKDNGVFDHESKTVNANDTLPAPTTYSEYKQNNEKRNKIPRFGIKKHGESGRNGIHPLRFLKICFRSSSWASMICNVLWPVVPAALAVRYSLTGYHTLKFILAYIAMVPCANLIGFAGQEFARKVPHVAGVLIEITCGSIVEIVLFMILLSNDEFQVIKAAMLGSILATMLLCLGLCFFAGGLRRDEQTFNDAISEAGSNLLLTAGVVLAVPTVFKYGVSAVIAGEGGLTAAESVAATRKISQIISILLIIAYLVYVFFQVRTHHGIYDAIFEHDEHRDEDKHEDAAKPKLTMTECIIALVIAVALVSIIAYILVNEIEPVIEKRRVSDAFMGLILVPLVEKFAEHLTAIDEAWDNQMNFALSHVLGATLQTALFNAPLAVIVSWGLHKQNYLDLNFDIFNLVMLLLAIITVGRFLQDQKSNYLEGSLLVILYIAIAVSAWYTPNPPHEAAEGGGGEGSHEPAKEALRMMARSLI